METDDLTFPSSAEYVKAVYGLMMSGPSMDISPWEILWNLGLQNW